MKYLITAIIALSLLGCKKDHEGYAVAGELKDVENGKMVYVSRLDQNNQPLKHDSIAVENEKFSLDLPETESPTLSFLNVEGINGNVIFISENETINFEIDKDSIHNSKVTGGNENKVFQQYLDHLKELNTKVTKIRNNMRQAFSSNPDSLTIVKLQQEEEALRTSDMAFKKKMINENPDAYASVLILTDMFNMGAPYADLTDFYGKLSEQNKQTPIAQNLKAELDKRSATEVGSKAPEFSGPNPQGEELALKNLLGKVTLIDFWAAWCKPCRDENPNIVNVYNKYHDKGFNIVGVSLDREGQKDKWVQAIAEDNLDWPQISNLQFWQDPIAVKYGIRAIPAAFILDENGVIVAKNLRGPDLEKKVKELLGE